MDNTIQLIERRLQQLRTIIPLYKWKPPLENWLAFEIIDWEIRRNEYLNSHPTPLFQQPLISALSLVQRPPQLPLPTPLQNPSAIPNTMPGNLTGQPGQTINSRAYWQLGQPVGAPARYFRQIRYLPLPNAVPDLDKALSGAWVDCGQDHHKELCEFGGAVKVWELFRLCTSRSSQWQIQSHLNNTWAPLRHGSSALTDRSLPTRIPISAVCASCQTESWNLTRNSSETNLVSDSPVFCNSFWRWWSLRL